MPKGVFLCLFKTGNFPRLCLAVHHSGLIFLSTRYAHQIILIFEILLKLYLPFLCMKLIFFFPSGTPVLNIYHFLSNQVYIIFPFWFKRYPLFYLQIFLNEKDIYSALWSFFFECIFWFFSLLFLIHSWILIISEIFFQFWFLLFFHLLYYFLNVMKEKAKFWSTL